MEPTIYIDMDDTIADFKTAYQEGLKNATTEKERMYPQSKIGFFINLKPLPGAIEGVNHLISQGYNVCFLTRPSIMNTHCYTEKAEWIAKHFGQKKLNDLYFGCDKSKLIGDYLIDDHIDNAGFKGNFIQFGSYGLETWDKVISIIDHIENDIENTPKKVFKYQIERLIDLKNEEIRAMYDSWDKGDCSTIGLLKILMAQHIIYEEKDQYYDNEHDDLKEIIINRK